MLLMNVFVFFEALSACVVSKALRADRVVCWIGSVVGKTELFVGSEAFSATNFLTVAKNVRS